MGRHEAEALVEFVGARVRIEGIDTRMAVTSGSEKQRANARRMHRLAGIVLAARIRLADPDVEARRLGSMWPQ